MSPRVHNLALKYLISTSGYHFTLKAHFDLVSWTASAWPNSGGGGYRGEQLPGSGGNLDPLLQAKIYTQSGIQTPEDDVRYVTQGRTKKDTRDTDSPGWVHPWRLSGTWVQAKVEKGGENGQGKTTDSGMWRGAQRRATEAGGRRGWKTSRWTAFRAGRGGGERVIQRVQQLQTATYGGR